MRRPPAVFLNRLEKLLIRMIIVTASLLVLVQAMVVDQPNNIMAQVATDAEPATATAHWSEPRITFYLENYSALPHLAVLVNNGKVAAFNNRYVTIAVQHGDVISIDSTFYRHSTKVKIINISSDINNQLVDKQITLHSNIVPVCTIKTK